MNVSERSDTVPIDHCRIEVVDLQMAEILRAKTTTQRVAMVLNANGTVRRLIKGRLRTQSPAFSLLERHQEIAKRMLMPIWQAILKRIDEVYGGQT